MVIIIETKYKLKNKGYGSYVIDGKIVIGDYKDIFKTLKYRGVKYKEFVVDIFGNVYNIKKSCKVITKLNPKNGYVYVRLDLPGSNYSWNLLHRVVAYTYKKNPFNLPEVDHVDGDKTNNRPSNLEWVSDHENKIRAVKNGLFHSGLNHYESRFTEESLHELWDNLINTKKTFRELAKEFKVEPSTIREIYIGDRYENIRDQYKHLIPDKRHDPRLHKTTRREDVLKAREMFKTGMSLKEIVKKTGVQPYYIKCRKNNPYYSKLYNSIK